MTRSWEEKFPDRRRKHKREAMATYRKKHRSRYLKTLKEHYYKNREKIRVAASKFNLSMKKRVIVGYGGCCECCGINDYRFLTVDHKNNDGVKHRKQYRGSINSFIIKNKFPNEFRVLCFNCNCAREHYGGKYKICPHKIKLSD